VIRVIFQRVIFNNLKLIFFIFWQEILREDWKVRGIRHNHYLEGGQELHSKLTGSSRVCHDGKPSDKTYLRVIKPNTVLRGKLVATISKIKITKWREVNFFSLLHPPGKYF